MREVRYQIIQQTDGGYEIYRETATKSEAQSQLNALDFSGVPGLSIREYIIEKSKKVFELSLAPIQFSL